MSRLRLGTFDAERFWRPDQLAELPRVGRDAATVARMDEVLAGFCRPGDVLVTRGPMREVLREQLSEAGIRFVHRYLPGSDDADAVERRAMRHLDVSEPAPSGLVPYAVLPETAVLAARLGLAGDLPDPAIVAKVNSKTWSAELAERWDLPFPGRVVRSTAELDAAVRDCPGPVLVKDPYGVSGRGTIEIATHGVLTAVRRVLDRQVEAGGRVELVVQPKLDRRLDFSAHFEIGSDGTSTWRGITMMDNRGFSYQGSGPATPELLHSLDVACYSAVGKVTEALAAAGYRGPAGVDSMMLADGRLVPVLEVNARQSMGLLTLELNERLAGSRSGFVRILDVMVQPGFDIGDLLAALRADGALYSAGTKAGVVVLSGSFLGPPRGRIHYLLVCERTEAGSWSKRMAAALAAAGMRIRGEVRAA